MRFIFACIAVALLMPQLAAAITLSPLPKIELDSTGAATAWLSDDNHYWEASIFRVVQHPDGSESFIEAPEIELRPMLLQAPGSLKISTLAPPDKSKETFYRVLLQQIIPKEELDAAQGLLLPGRFTIPVISNPSDVQVQHTCMPNGFVRNDGNTHLKFLVSGESNAWAVAEKNNLFPGGYKDFAKYMEEIKAAVEIVKKADAKSRTDKPITDVGKKFGLTPDQQRDIQIAAGSNGQPFYILPGASRYAAGFAFLKSVNGSEVVSNPLCPIAAKEAIREN